MRSGRRHSDRALRAVLQRSPGRPGVAQRENRRRFWAAIALGRSSQAAAIELGVSQAVGARWFREAGGMPPSHLSRSSKPLSGRSLSFAEREEIAIWRAQGHGVRAIARRLERAPSTISRELRRHAQRRSGVSGHHRAMACRPIRPPSEAGQAGEQRGAAVLRTGPVGWYSRRAERESGSRTRRELEGPPAWASAGPTVGHSVEPRADCPTAATRLS